MLKMCRSVCNFSQRLIATIITLNTKYRSSENTTYHSTPFYRIKDLVATKYGDIDYEAGCSLVARWMSFETKTTINIDDIKSYAKPN